MGGCILGFFKSVRESIVASAGLVQPATREGPLQVEVKQMESNLRRIAQTGKLVVQDQSAENASANSASRAARSASLSQSSMNGAR